MATAQGGILMKDGGLSQLCPLENGKGLQNGRSTCSPWCLKLYENRSRLGITCRINLLIMSTLVVNLAPVGEGLGVSKPQRFELRLDEKPAITIGRAEKRVDIVVKHEGIHDGVVWNRATNA